MGLSTYTVAATVVRVNAYQYKASWANGDYAGSFSMLRDAQSLIERSISPGAAPLPWKRQERDDGVELWYVLKDASGYIPVESARFLFSGVTPPPTSAAKLTAVSSAAAVKSTRAATSPIQLVLKAAGFRPVSRPSVASSK